MEDYDEDTDEDVGVFPEETNGDKDYFEEEEE